MNPIKLGKVDLKESFDLWIHNHCVSKELFEKLFMV